MHKNFFGRVLYMGSVGVLHSFESFKCQGCVSAPVLFLKAQYLKQALVGVALKAPQTKCNT